MDDHGAGWDGKRPASEAGGGSGQGLAPHSTRLAVESAPGAYTRLVFTSLPNAA